METALFTTSNLHWAAPCFVLIAMSILMFFLVLKAMIETTPHKSTTNFTPMNAEGAKNPGSFKSDIQDAGRCEATSKGTQSN